MSRLALTVQDAAGQHTQPAFVNQGCTGEEPAAAAPEQGIVLEAGKPPHAKKGFVLLSRRRMVERSFSWATRFRRLARDYDGCRRRWRACISSHLPA